MGLSMKTPEEKRQLFEKLWVDGGGHFKFFKFSKDHEKYIYSGVMCDLSEYELRVGLITLNTAYLFYLGGWKQAESLRA